MNNDKALPPLKSELGFLANVIILSYYGYMETSFKLLNRLSKTTKKYLELHKESAEPFFRN